MDGFGSVAGMRGPLSNGPEAWYRGLPPITRAVMTATFVLTLLATLDFLPVHVFVLDWSLVVGKLQVWRLLTTVLFIGKFSLGWMLHMYMWVQISGDLENNAVFARASAGAYLMFVFLMTISTSLLSLLVFWPRGASRPSSAAPLAAYPDLSRARCFSGVLSSGLPFHSEAVLFAALYYWSRREAYTPVSIYFLTVQGYQLPFVLLLLHLLIGRDLWLDAIGMAAGHAYYFFREILPAQGKVSRPLSVCAQRLELRVHACTHSCSHLVRGVRVCGTSFPSLQTGRTCFPRRPSALSRLPSSSRTEVCSPPLGVARRPAEVLRLLSPAEIPRPLLEALPDAGRAARVLREKETTTTTTAALGVLCAAARVRRLPVQNPSQGQDTR